MEGLCSLRNAPEPAEEWGKERRVVGPSVRKGVTQVRFLTTFIKGGGESA